MYWRNSNFQYINFIFGACHTPIEAHRKCVEAIEDREIAVYEAKQTTADLTTPQGRQYANIVSQAERELEFLNQCREKIEAYIGKVPTIDDYQENQQLEWKLELANRIENNLMCTGTIPPEQFAAIRQHPEFKELYDHINYINQSLTENTNFELLGPTWKKDIGLLENKSSS